MLILDAKIYNFGHYTPIHELRYGEGKLLAWRVIDDPNFAVKDLCMHVFGANFGVSINAILESTPPPKKKKKKNSSRLFAKSKNKDNLQRFLVLSPKITCTRAYSRGNSILKASNILQQVV
jgi:hypothetical protein